MYRFSERLVLMQDLGVVEIKVYKVPNERPLPGEKLAGGVELAVQNDQGFLGGFNPQQKLTFALVVEIERRDDLHIVWAEGRDRNIKPLGDQTSDAATALFSKRIPTDRTLSGDYVTKSTDNLGNGIWVISTADGQLRMWEAAIVTILADSPTAKRREARYYLSLQKVYAVEMFNLAVAEHDDHLIIPEEQFPGWGDWSSLQSFLLERVSTSRLRPFSEYQSVAPEESALAVGQAEVVWFNQAKGFGFARVDGEERNPIFYRASVQDQEFPAFNPGQVVGYALLERTGKGARLRGVVEL
jgi:cold shock CspA family protein